MRRLRLRDSGPPGYTLPQCVPWSCPLPPTAAFPGPALSHGPGLRGVVGNFGGRGAQRDAQICLGPHSPYSKSARVWGCLRERGATFGMLRVGRRPWSCRQLQLWPWPRPLCPPTPADCSETRFGRGETIPELTLEPAQTPILLLSIRAFYFYSGLSARKARGDHTTPTPTLPRGGS